MAEKHTCEKIVPNWPARSLPCNKTAKHYEADSNGNMKWFCGTHAPSRIKAREEKRERKRGEEDRKRFLWQMGQQYNYNTCLCRNIVDSWWRIPDVSFGKNAQSNLVDFMKANYAYLPHELDEIANARMLADKDHFNFTPEEIANCFK